jgi:hypothetical protein
MSVDPYFRHPPEAIECLRLLKDGMPIPESVQLWTTYCEINHLMDHLGACGSLRVNALGLLVLEQYSQKSPSQGARKASGQTVQHICECLEQLRRQGEPFTSQKTLADQLGCSSGTINKAIKRTPSLQPWAQSRKPTAPKAQSLTEVVTDCAAQGREDDPGEAAALRELRTFVENADPEVRGWFLGLSPKQQQEVLDDPDQYPRILGRKA